MTAPPDDRVTQLLRIEYPRWFRPALLKWLADPEGRPLEFHLSLDRVGHRLAVHNHHIAQAWDKTDEALSPWKRCLELHDEIERFRSAVWPRVWDLAKPDVRWSAQRTALRHAFRAGAAVPGTARMFSEIVKSQRVEISQNAVETEAGTVNPNRRTAV